MRSAIAKLPRNLYSSARVRELEPVLAKRQGVLMWSLMEQAGEAAWQRLRQRWPNINTMTVICGRGNNAGDGYVVARQAMEAGLEVRLLQLQTNRQLSGDARLAQKQFLSSGGHIQEATCEAIGTPDLIVDALLGTGFQGQLRLEVGQLVSAINDNGAPVMSLDLPSGLEADTGHVETVAVAADLTVTFVAVKQGLLTGQAASYCGDILLEPLCIGQELAQEEVPQSYKINYQDFLEHLQPRVADSHKGHHGRIAVIGGNHGMPGAVRLASEAALRSGAGLVSIISRYENLPLIQAGRPELMLWGSDIADIEVYQRVSWGQVVLCGPGLGSGDWAYHMWRVALNAERPLVMDADALNILAKHPQKRQDWVLTPHPGEAARLLGVETIEVQRDRFWAAQELYRRYGGVIVLKGAGTLIYDGARMLVAPVGNPGLATGGSGDVLSGIIASLLAQGLPPCEAAACGVCLHGEAADYAAEAGQRGMLASDLMPYIRQLVNP
ncbi:NAD(P)H-hydrate dehydratase [Ferrimonas aestuarii]|uniref:Bifunctional NAD(P)H-hydrate repair enzyme n=1 Tax=Ferrimonas aestuarii TaxID=2569539 RepID=A0A4U1BTA2_9GAMM|nr:NAD(P)H-hydrate dehydratase [Ferrimonas aestuarii]TKB56857.1 NAD(P)H-hydrate dehydratase [Ferrimonas aestuarii]